MPPLLPAAFSGPRSSASSATPSIGGGGLIDFQLQNDIPASSFISVLVGDAVNPALGDVPQVVGVADSATNVYTVDDQNTEFMFGGDIFMASCVNAQALSSGDTITLHVDQWPWTSFYLLVVAFTDAVTGFDVAGEDGNNYTAPAGGSLSPNVMPTTTTDLLIGVAVYGTPVTDDPAWTHVLYANDATDYMTVAYRQTSTTALVAYTTSSAVPTDSATYYGGSSCCAYRLGGVPPPPPGMSTVVVGNQTYGLRER